MGLSCFSVSQLINLHKILISSKKGKAKLTPYFNKEYFGWGLNDLLNLPRLSTGIFQNFTEIEYLSSVSCRKCLMCNTIMWANFEEIITSITLTPNLVIYETYSACFNCGVTSKGYSTSTYKFPPVFSSVYRQLARGQMAPPLLCVFLLPLTSCLH